jgi:hypothetical protein
MIGSSRVLLEMASDVRWLRPLAKVWARRKTPLLLLGFTVYGLWRGAPQP